MKYNALKYLPNNFQYDDEGLWSLTLPHDANRISNIILDEFGTNIIIMDCTAGLGGNTISFCNYFIFVISIENDYYRFNMLKNNIDLLNISNIYLINDDCINVLLNKFNKNDRNDFCKNYLVRNINCYFIDPPWGGINYKKKKLI